jgi:hypothetical protein
MSGSVIRCARFESLVSAVVVPGSLWEVETAKEPPSVSDTKWSLEAKEAKGAGPRTAPRT